MLDVAGTESMVQHLLLDALVTAKVEKKWMSMSTVDIDARFVATNGGLTRIYPKRSPHIFVLNQMIKCSFLLRI